jgi:hypothetical protein
MGMLTKIRLGIAVVVGVPVLLFMAYSALNTYFTGAGKVHLVGPYDGTAVSVDGKPAQELGEGEHLRLELAQGEHTLAFGDVSRKVQVKNGFTELLVPVSEEQCFVLLDVSKSHYDFGHGGGVPLPKLDRRFKGNIGELPSHTYFGESALPSSINEGDSCNLLEEVDCEELDLDDSKLITELGFR